MSRSLRSFFDSSSTGASGRRIRLPAGLGCLLPILALPIALVALIVTLVHSLIRSGTRSARLPPAQESALRSLVQKMALDDDFSEDDARMAGLPPDAGVEVDALLGHAERRGWVERRGDRYAVTPEGREA